MKKVSSLLLVLMLAVPALACNFGATQPTATASGAASNNTTAPTTGATTAPSAAPSATPANTTAPTATPTTAPSATTVPSATPANTTAPENTVAASPVPNTAAVSGDCTPGNGKTVTTASELKIEDLLICPGTPVQMGMTVTINYIGTLKDGGTKFYSTIDKGQPFNFVLGSNTVPKGLSEGMVGMTVNSKRRLTVPPLLGYGKEGGPGVPPNATLIYEVTLLSIKP